MLRQLLTVLAILTGLAAAGAPAQAGQVNGVAGVRGSVRLVATAELSVKCTLPSAGPALTPPAPRRDGAKAACPRPRPPVILPPVMLGADRALE